MSGCAFHKLLFFFFFYHGPKPARPRWFARGTYACSPPRAPPWPRMWQRFTPDGQNTGLFSLLGRSSLNMSTTSRSKRRCRNSKRNYIEADVYHQPTPASTRGAAPPTGGNTAGKMRRTARCTSEPATLSSGLSRSPVPVPESTAFTADLNRWLGVGSWWF